MTHRSASILKHTRLAAFIAAAGLSFAAPAMAQTTLPPPAFGQADARQDRIEELEGQLREATAENERLQYEIIQRDREITRLRGMVGELAGVNQSLSTPPAEGAAPAPGAATPAPNGGGGQASNSGLNEAQRAAVGTLGAIPAATAPSGSNPPPAAAAAPADPAAQYSRARELLVAGQLAEAETAFADFLQAHPRANTAVDARFWLAYTQLARNNYNDAATNFLAYMRAAPNGPRAAEAQVRLGMALIGGDRRAEGCGAFTSLATRYPNAPRNIRDLATREARAAQCGA
ncbi:tetratricopeptide repeat protein [Vitreimonas flagellata]|uniref:tetratricopeptide repeat protein n=1 Tax=Vitreimonas flagellata TaxID=2560861 RepID=UPI001075054F|nr:tetratricopeptide repeat protein [Vitreimonas flagellata]